MSAGATSTPPVTRIGWVGLKPSWFDMDGLAGITFVGDVTKADVVHAAVRPATLAGLRRALPPDCALVFHLPKGTRLGLRDARRVRAADLIVVQSAAELQELTRRQPQLAARTNLLRPPVDLDWHAPEPQLLETPRRGRDLRRFRRFHRLAPPVVLYAGPYTHEGGLDLALEAVAELRTRIPEARLAAIPEGEVDRGYLDAIERQALALGHHAVIEWTVPEYEIPFWYACADIVCAPHRAAVSTDAAAFAAAAGRPWVGSDFEVVREYVQNGQTGYLVEPNDLETLAAALVALGEGEDEARRLGEEGRRWAERSLTAAAAMRQLQELSTEALFVHRAESVGSVARPVGLATR